MIAFFILLVAAFAEEQFSQPEEVRQHMDPEEGLAVVFYSKQYRFAKLADPGRDNDPVYVESADAHPRNLFLLDKDQGDYFIRDAHYNRRLGCASNTKIYAVPSDSTIWPDQLWKFNGPNSNGFYEIENVHRPGWKIGMTGSSSVACFDSKGSKGDKWLWRLEDIFTATAMWKSIAELDNTSGVDGNYQYKKTIGYTQSIEKSEAKTESISQSLEFSAGGSLMGIDLGGTSTTTMTSEFSQSVSNAMSGTFTTEETLTWPVPAGHCIQILQIQVSQDDTMTKIKNMAFYGSKTKIQDCPGHTERGVGVYYNSVSEEEKMEIALAARNSMTRLRLDETAEMAVGSCLQNCLADHRAYDPMEDCSRMCLASEAAVGSCMSQCLADHRAYDPTEDCRGMC